MCLFGLTIKCKERDSCNLGLSPINPIGNIVLENVSFIKINKGGQVYEIRDREKLKYILENLKKSHIKYIKFGSKDTFKIYDNNPLSIIPVNLIEVFTISAFSSFNFIIFI